MTAFFIPGSTDAGSDPGDVRGDPKTALAGNGDSARPVRIFKLSFRHGGADLEAEVGQPDPVDGHKVLAILDLGRHSPYLIHCVGGSDMQVLVRKPSTPSPSSPPEHTAALDEKAVVRSSLSLCMECSSRARRGLAAGVRRKRKCTGNRVDGRVSSKAVVSDR